MERMTERRLQELYQRAVASGAALRGSHLPPERLQALVDGALSEEDRATAFDHVMTCPDCRAGYDLLTTLSRARPPEPRRYLVPLALAATAILAVGVLTRDRWIGDDPTRGSGAAPVLVGPTGAVVASDAARFVWRPGAGAVQYQLEVLDPRGGVVHTALTTDTTYALPAEVRLGADIEYQWVVTGETKSGARTPSVVGRFQLRP